MSLWLVERGVIMHLGEDVYNVKIKQKLFWYMLTWFDLKPTERKMKITGFSSKCFVLTVNNFSRRIKFHIF